MRPDPTHRRPPPPGALERVRRDGRRRRTRLASIVLSLAALPLAATLVLTLDASDERDVLAVCARGIVLLR